MLISKYNHFATTNRIWSTIRNVATGRMEVHSNPVASTLNLKSVPKKVSGENRVKENNMMVLLEKFSTLNSLIIQENTACGNVYFRKRIYYHCRVLEKCRQEYYISIVQVFTLVDAVYLNFIRIYRYN